MNKVRRKAIREIITKLEDIEGEIDEILNQEQDSFDNLPESLQESDKGENMQEVINALENAISNIDESMSDLEEAIEY